MQFRHKSAPNIKEEDQPPPLVKSLDRKGSFFMPRTANLTSAGKLSKRLFPFYPHYFEKTLTKSQQNYYSANGHFSLLKSLQVQVFSQIDDCRLLWQEFSPGTTLFDTWNFRLAFWRGYRHRPYFLVLKNRLENLALLPLQYESDKKRYAWFGSAWQEENQFFVKDPLFVPLLLAICPSPVTLNAISIKMPLWSKKVIRLKPDDPKYILRLNSIGSAEDYLNTLKKKKRYNLKRDQRIIQNQNPEIVINRFEDFNDLVRLSLRRFHDKGEDADWEDPRRTETFRQVLKLGKSAKDYQIRMISIVIGSKIASVDLIALFKNCYSPLKCGYDVKNFPGIGNFVNLLEIDDAASLGMEKMDFLEIGYGWKDKWFEAVPLLKYEKK